MSQRIASTYQIILASGSPRRQQLLKDIGIAYEIQLKEVEERYPSHLKGAEITDYLAKLKASPFKGTLQQNDLLITSDTIVWLDGEALGKPKNANEAFEMLRSLSGNQHQVITSVCLTATNFQKVFNDSTTVSFHELSDEFGIKFTQNEEQVLKAAKKKKK